QQGGKEKNDPPPRLDREPQREPRGERQPDDRQSPAELPGGEPALAKRFAEKDPGRGEHRRDDRPPGQEAAPFSRQPAVDSDRAEQRQPKLQAEDQPMVRRPAEQRQRGEQIVDSR